MKVLDRYPLDTALGSCLITRNSNVPPGERVIDLQKRLDDLPVHGRLCISENAVRLLNAALGWESDPRLESKVASQREQLKVLRAENKRLRDALRAVFAAAEVAEADVNVDDETAAIVAEEVPA